MKQFRHNMLGAGYLAALPLTLNAISLFATAFIIHQLGPFNYGEWAVAASLTATSAFLSNLGLRPLFIRRLAEEPSRAEEWLGEQLTLRVILGAVAASVAVGAAYLLGYDRTVVTCTAIAATGLMLTVVWTGFADVLQAAKRFREFAIVQFISGLALTGCSVAGVANGFGPIGVACAYLAGPFINLMLLALLVRRQRIAIAPCWAPARFYRLLYESRNLGVQQLVVTLRDRAEELVVPKLLGLTAFGYFTAGVMPSDRLSIVPDGISTAFYPTIAGASGEERRAAAMTMMRLAMLATVPIAVALAAAAPWIASVLFPVDGGRCRLVMQITAFSIPVAAAGRCLFAALQAAGRHDQAARSSVLATFIGAALSVALISQLGLIGAACSLITRGAVLAVLLAPEFRRTFRSSVPRTRELFTRSEAQAGI